MTVLTIRVNISLSQNQSQVSVTVLTIRVNISLFQNQSQGIKTSNSSNNQCKACGRLCRRAAAGLRTLESSTERHM